MNTITLTADELARWERGERRWIVAGEPYSNLTITPAFHDNTDPIVLPPVRWRDAVSLRCTYCNRAFPFECSCARAREARKIGQVIELWATCPTYGETHIGYRDPNGGRSRKAGGGTGACEHDPPCERGSVLVAIVSVEVHDAEPFGSDFVVVLTEVQS